VNEDKSNLQIYLDLIDSMQFIYRIHSFNQIRIKLEEMQSKESVFRERMNKILDDENYQSILTIEQKEKFAKYLKKDLSYFDGQKYNQEELIFFRKPYSNSMNSVHEHLLCFKEIAGFSN